ncbi:acetyl-CoA C-acetyltransferase [Psychrobacter sp. Sarcosine-3u-12]|uniref:acetyl-CoA C-acetyltransferase n=1 Tax=Psychrobacter sp. Sarcosine-3u-12 TaxID=2058325 RepID=UPI000C330D2E|nr:acetyl-CoA C-acetyltransferase [Psychrobacter sp. Sarcosine-3u-12]PKG36311.1 acetyl-CoA C-acyltransferase [Psychrobacter sp. Sarcosine-3u-12]
MSNKNNHPESPVVESTVVKSTDSKANNAKSENTKSDNAKSADSAKKDTAANKTSSTDNKATTVKTSAVKDTDTKNTNTKSTASAKETDDKVDTAAAKKTATAAKKSSTSKLTSGQNRVAILGGNRIPFARSNGSYADVSNTDMLTAALNGLVERFNLQDEKIGEVVAGAVMKLSRDINLTREATLNTALNPHTPTYDISQACGTGLQATFASANKIALGIIDSAITGGVDTTSDAPIAVGDGLRKVLIKLGAAKDNKQRLKALMGLNPKDLIDSPQNGEPRTGLSMGDHQAITALEWNISREAQDELAFNSHQNLARAYDKGFFDDLITPYKGLTRDNNLRPDTTLEKLAKLKPVFGKKNANPTMTAANSTPLTDGASCVLLGTDEWAKEHGLKPLAYIVHQETAAVDFIGKSGTTEGLLMAPAYAVPRMLERAGLTLQDFDFYEIHEAFASQVLSTLAAWEDETFCEERLGLDAPLGSIDRSKLNVNGSSLAAGHPFAATGGRILATAAKLLDQKGSGRALISICAAGGQGVTCILEK